MRERGEEEGCVVSEVRGDGQSRALYYDTRQHSGASPRIQSKAQLSMPICPNPGFVFIHFFRCFLSTRQSPFQQNFAPTPTKTTRAHAQLALGPQPSKTQAGRPPTTKKFSRFFCGMSFFCKSNFLDKKTRPVVRSRGF